MTQVATTQNNIKLFFEKDSVKNRFKEMLGKRSNQFISSIIQITANNSYLSKADPISVYNSAMMAATLDLPINQSLGFAWVVPYKNKSGVFEAQFQIGWRGIVQLALRTGQYKSINVIDVYENQLKSFNYLTEELDADFSIAGNGKIVGYACYFSLVSGFSKTSYWTIDQAQSHGRKYSKTFNNGPWKSDFDAMAKKTVLKNTLSKWGILSIEMQTAIKVDQAVIKDEEGNVVEYVDHEEVKVNPESERLLNLIADADTIDELESYQEDVNALEDEEVRAAYQDRYMDLTPKE